MLRFPAHRRRPPQKLVVSRLVRGDEDAVADLGVDGFRQVALAGRVLDQDHLAGADDAGLTVARGDLHAGVEIDDVLPARRGVPVEVVGGLDLAEDDPGGGQRLLSLPARPSSTHSTSMSRKCD